MQCSELRGEDKRLKMHMTISKSEQMMDRLSAMQVFAEVASSGSFSATADKLDMSRAMVTRYIDELEQWLGARLIQRTTRSLTLTDAGEQCLRRSQQMLALMENIEEETASQDGALRGQLRLTCSMSLGYSYLAAALADFLALHPQLKIDLNLSEGALNLVDARIDLAIRISSEPDPMLIARPLARCASALVASPAYIAQHGQVKTPAGLIQHRCLSHSSFCKTVWRFTREERLADTNAPEDSELVSVPTHFTANDTTTLMQAALAGGGLALLPTYLVSPHLQSGALIRVLADWKVPEMMVYALYPSRRHLSPAVRALLDFLVQRFSTLP